MPSNRVGLLGAAGPELAQGLGDLGAGRVVLPQRVPEVARDFERERGRSVVTPALRLLRAERKSLRDGFYSQGLSPAASG